MESVPAKIADIRLNTCRTWLDKHAGSEYRGVTLYADASGVSPWRFSDGVKKPGVSMRFRVRVQWETLSIGAAGV